MLFGIFFVSWRFAQIITLIPIVGMLSYFVNIYVNANALTPTSILVLFIVSVLAVVWAIMTLFTYHRTKTNSLFVAWVDLLFFGAFVGADYALRGIGNDNCATLDFYNYSYTLSVTGVVTAVTGVAPDLTLNKGCSMLKASWAFGIMNTIFFFITSMIACTLGRSGRKKEEVIVTRSETHHSRHGHRRSGSHRSRRSSHSGRRHAYV